ncbi:MAG: FtsW/RodA/SpoVE family cell cycle protein [bacterium]
MRELFSKAEGFPRRFDWLLILPAITLTLLGVLTMNTFGVGASLAPRQLEWLVLAVFAYFALSSLDLRFLRRKEVVFAAYALAVALLALLLLVAHKVMGAKSWFLLGGFSFQPADFAKLALVMLLSKYLSRRHVDIAQLKHVIISGLYAAALILLVLVQPDLGTAVILSAVWLGMMLVSGISKKHLALVALAGIVAAAGFWSLGLHDYQRTRIVAFLNPAADIRGAGYNAYQATVAVGSGEWLGKGIGYGTQSKLRFLPEYETDFVFAAFAEEWGFVGVLLLLLLYGLLLARLIDIAKRAATNFDAFFTLGVALVLMAHLFIHAGINLGLLPVTGTTIPFMSSGGSHLLMEFAALGIVSSLARHGRSVSRSLAGQEYIG